jgi:hypothetical protein
MFLGVVLALAAASLPSVTSAQEADLPYYLKDRGTGQPVSMFGSYIREGEFLIMPFFEYYLDDDFEYKPAELVTGGRDEDFRGRFRASEGLIFMAYGFTDWFAIEAEVAVITAKLRKAANDPTPDSQLPRELKQSGLGDVEGQLRFRFARETEGRPEFFGYFEAVSPAQKKKKLIGTSDWEVKPGLGIIKGFHWGTMQFRVATEYAFEDEAFDVGEYALEYIKRLSPDWRIYAGLEGSQDEVSAITEVQYFFTDRIYFKFNNGFALTSKATDWAPEYGIMFSIPTRGK